MKRLSIVPRNAGADVVLLTFAGAFSLTIGYALAMVFYEVVFA